MKRMKAVARQDVELAIVSRTDLAQAKLAFQPFLGCLMIMLKDYDKNGVPPQAISYLKKNGKDTTFLKRYGFSAEVAKAWAKACATFATSKKYDGPVEELLDDVCIEMKVLLPNMVKDPALPHAVLAYIKDAALLGRTGSESAYDRTMKNFGVLDIDELNPVFTAAKVAKPTSAKGVLSAIVRSLTGAPGLEIPPEKAATLKTKKPKLYAEYLKARKALTDLSRQKLMQIVRSSGKKLVDAQKVAAELTKEGYVHRIPVGFVGLLDDKGSMYTVAGRLLPGTIGKIVMNPKYDPQTDNTYVFQAITDKGTNNIYTVDYRQNKNVQKHQKIKSFSGNIDALRAKWGKGLVADGKKEQIAAAIVEIAYQTAARIGNPGNQTDGKATFGLTTSLVKQARIISANKVSITYVGKSGVKQRNLMEGTDRLSKKAVQIVKELISNGAPSDRLFRFNNSPVTSQTVNQYLKSLGSPVTIKGVRTLKGTQMARDLLAKSPFDGKTGVDQKAATDWLKKQITKVGGVLGHVSGDKVTPGTALKSYIDGDVIQEYYDRIGVRPPAAIEAIIKTNTKTH